MFESGCGDFHFDQGSVIDSAGICTNEYSEFLPVTL